jgi:hypothetical protein
MIYYDIYLINAIGFTAGGSSTVHIYTYTIHRTTKLNTISIIIVILICIFNKIHEEKIYKYFYM